MKSQIKIEAIGDDVDHLLRQFSALADIYVPGLGEMTFGKNPASYWVAEIKDFHPKWKYERDFLRGKKDYTHANRKGSRGVFVYYLLECPRVYEVKTTKRRYFCTVNTTGDIIEISKEDVDEWIRENAVLE